jgi:hypothetical protein
MLHSTKMTLEFFFKGGELGVCVELGDSTAHKKSGENYEKKGCHNNYSSLKLRPGKHMTTDVTCQVHLSADMFTMSTVPIGRT